MFGWTQPWLANYGYKESLKRTSTAAGTGNAEVGQKVHYLTNLSLRIELKSKLNFISSRFIWSRKLAFLTFSFIINKITRKNYKLNWKYKINKNTIMIKFDFYWFLSLFFVSFLEIKALYKTESFSPLPIWFIQIWICNSTISVCIVWLRSLLLSS